MKISSVRYIDNPAEQIPKGFYLRVNDLRVALGLPFTKLDELIQGKDGKFPTRYIECVVRMAQAFQVSCDYLFGLTDITVPYPRSEMMPTGLDTTRVRELRKKRKVKNQILADVINTAKNTYYQKETPGNRFAFTMYDIVCLAEFFQVSTDYLLHLTDTPEPYREGPHEFVPLSAEAKLRIQNALGLTPKIEAGAESFCLSHFRLKEIRLKRKLPVEAVAKVLHIDHMTYDKYEKKPYTIPIYTLIKLADYYCVSLDYLTGRSNKKSWDKQSAYADTIKGY